MAMGGKKKPRTRFICWNCGQAVPLKFSGRACPNCGAPLTAMAYDAYAQRLAKQRVELEREAHKLQAKLEVATKKNARWGILKKLPFLPSRRAIEELTPQIEQYWTEVSNLARKSRLAPDRYYASEWFRQSRCFLRDDTPDPQVKANNPFKTPHYDQDGVFHMLPARDNSWQRGEYGEYVVVSLLADAIEAGKLGHARLLWHLYVPVRQRSRPHESLGIERTDEIDIVLLTTRGLYSVEVKSLHSHIEVRLDNYKDAYCVTATPIGREGRPLADRSMVDVGIAQNAAHVSSLRAELADRVAPQRVFNVTTYTSHCGFEMHAPQGFGDAYVATTSECSENVLRVIQGIEQGMDAYWTDAQVDELADQLSVSYADPDGSKRANHAKVIRASREPPTPSPKPYKKRAYKPQTTKSKARSKYQSRKSKFIDEDVRDYLNGDYED